MKKYLISLIIIFAILFVSVPIAKASTLDDLMIQIKSLQEQVSQLSSQLYASVTGASGSLLKLNTKGSGFCDGTGDGSTNNPYEINSCIDLQNIKNNLNANYELCSNIDCSNTINWNAGQGFEPIAGGSSGTLNPFTGTISGNDYSISSVFINRPLMDGVGIIGKANRLSQNPGYFKNFKVTGDIDGRYYVGGVVGSAKNYSFYNVQSSGYVQGNTFVGGLLGQGRLISIIESKAKSTIVSVGNSNGKIGGLVGSLEEGSVINSSSFSTVEGEQAVGGILGESYAVNINKCYSQGDLIASKYYIGGIIGFDKSTSVGTTITNSYSVNSITNTDLLPKNILGVGGIAGRLTSKSKITNSYSAGTITFSPPVNPGISLGVGGLTGANIGKTENSYFDSTLAGLLPACGSGNGPCNVNVSPKTTVQMKQQPTYINWDFINIWKIIPPLNAGYPVLP